MLRRPEISIKLSLVQCWDRHFCTSLRVCVCKYLLPLMKLRRLSSPTLPLFSSAFVVLFVCPVWAWSCYAWSKRTFVGISLARLLLVPLAILKTSQEFYRISKPFQWPVFIVSMHISTEHTVCVLNSSLPTRQPVILHRSHEELRLNQPLVTKNP